MERGADPCIALEQFQVPAGATQEWRSFVQLYLALRQPQRIWPADMQLAKRWYGPQLARIHDDAGVRLGDVENLERMASAYPSRERFLSELTLDPPDATSSEAGAAHRDEDYVILSTIHSAKGQEWTSVHVLNVVDGCIPSDMSTGNAAEVDEERRLLYVAMTRAKEHLQLLVPQRFYVTQQSAMGERHIYASRTRFIDDVQAAQFDTLVWPAAGEPDTSSPAAGAARLQVRERARLTWSR